MSRSTSDHRRAKPEYASPNAVGASLTAVPPFSFHGVSARVFPLSANIATLTTFCDTYLNMDIPKSITYFRPVVPYVYLIMLDYGDLSVDVGKRFMVSQREVSFAVPLQRFKEAKDGTLVFQDFALVHPFIYVDDEWSLETGREVYGWPKVLATMDADVNLWTKNPIGRSKLLSMSAGVFPKAYANQVLEKRTFLEVYSEPDLSFAQLPINSLNPLNPVVALQSAITSSFTLASNVAESLLGLNILGFAPTDSLDVMREKFGYSLDLAKSMLPEALLAQFGARNPGGPRKGDSARPRMLVNNVNLKQFRDAQNPDLFCYQELNYSVMGANRVNAAGLLGDLHVATGDLSGGFKVVLHQYPSQPIVETLGLVTSETADDDGVTRAILKPTLPFWCDMEFHYGAGKPLCWRTALRAPWSDETRAVWRENRRKDTAVSDYRRVTASDAPPQRPTYFTPDQLRDLGSAMNRGDAAVYNATRGSALEAVPGPFDLPDVTVRVFPLLADKARLQTLCDEYLNTDLENADLRFEPFGTYVYLTATNYGIEHGAMWSLTDNVGVWRQREVSFQVPVKWYARDNAGAPWRLVNIAMISPFAFANTSTHVASDREINGKTTEKAGIECPPGRWMDESGPDAPNTLLTLSTELLPALGLGQKTVDRTLLEIVSDDVLPYNADVPWRFVSEKWGTTLSNELRRKMRVRKEKIEDFFNLKSLALRLIASRSPIGAPFNEVVLRQIRDSSDPLHACFQALLLVQRSIKEVYDVREIEERTHVAIHSYPSHPIVETLGLHTKRVDNRGDSVVQFLQPVRPFWMRLGMTESLATNICRREGAVWEKPHLEMFERGDTADASRTFIQSMRATLDDILPQRVCEQLERTAQPAAGAVAGILEAMLPEEKSVGDAAEDQIEPQIVLESALSDEWENWGNPRWYRRANGEPNLRQKPDMSIRKDTIASREAQLFMTREGLMPSPSDADSLVPGPATLVVTPATATVRVGETQQLTAMVLDRDGIELSGMTIEWRTTSDSVAVVSSTGMMTGQHAGEDGIVAVCNGVIGGATVTVV